MNEITHRQLHGLELAGFRVKLDPKRWQHITWLCKFERKQ